MDLSNASVWWIAAGVAVAAELATGTFYPVSYTHLTLPTNREV